MSSSEDLNLPSRMDNSLINQDNQVFDDFVGVVVHGEVEAFNFYNNYALRIGFSVRKSKKRYDINRNIRQREYVCSKTGYHLDDKHYSTKQCHTLETRSGCEAMVRFSVDDGKWTVSKFVPNHNHELALPSEVHMLRSSRILTPSRTIQSMVDGVTSTTSTFSCVVKEARRDEHSGSTRKYRSEYVNQKNNLFIEAGDSQVLLDHLRQRSTRDGMFFYTMQVDQENRITNYFWRDSRSKMDYDSFGDVLVFDTTCQLKKYNLVCASFVGVNNHRQNVMFGSAMLLDKSTTSYIWLFESFLESMGGKAPQTIFTNEDQGIENAVAAVFPRSCHRLCIWHVLQNAPIQLGNLNSNSEFRHLFYKTLQKCESEEEFDQTWSQICDSFGALGTHDWLKRLYNNRQKWCKGLNKDIFSAGILSSRKFEATNGVLYKINKATSLANIAHQVEGIVADWRSFKSQEDFRCKQDMTSQVLKTSGLLKHAAATYTRDIFKQFEKQFWNVLATISTEATLSGNVRTYEVKGEAVGSKVRIVHYNTSTMAISCSCKKFESKGFICCHLLRVLWINNVTKIPESCILQRWTKEARKRRCEWEQGEIPTMAKSETDSLSCNEMMRHFYDIVTRCQDDEICRQLCRDALSKLRLDIDNQLSASNAKKPRHNNEDDTANFKKERSKAKKDLSSSETVKGRNVGVNTKLNGDGTSYGEVDPRTNFQIRKTS